jgi:hypothetical protein
VRSKIRFILPLLQLAVVVCLKVSNSLRPDTPESPSWYKPDIQVCHALNAPVGVCTDWMVQLAYRWLPDPFSMELFIHWVVYLALVWALWYVVSLESTGGGLSLVAPKTGARRVADIAAIGLGIALGTYGSLIWSSPRALDAYWMILSIPYFMWAAVIVIFYSHDLWASFRCEAKVRQPASAR